MELHPLDPIVPWWSSSSLLPPITYSKKVLNGQKHKKWRRPPWFCRAAEKIAEKVSRGIQKVSNKDLSRMLRTEAAIKAIERKASSKKKVRQASLLFDVMLSDGLRPTIDVYAALVNVYGLSGLFDQAFSTIDDMKSVYDCKPDVHTSYGKVAMYEKMESILNFMKKRFISLTVVTFNTIIDIFGRAGNIEKMDSLFLKIHEGMKPNTITYCSLVNAYSKAGKLYRVNSILRQVENSNVVLDTPFFNCIISAYGRVGDVDKMNKLFLLMKEKNCEPDNITFATMIQAYNAKA
ncbi:hypothetical protein Ancab_006553 [Ancistrocladus abbreviatus]